MADLNKVFLIGRLTQDPELRYTPSGAPVTDLRLAVNRYGAPGDDGERREEVLFTDVTVWNRQAENCCQYLTKGRQVHVEGFLRLDTWDDKTTGEKRSKMKIVADRIQFIDSRRDESGAGVRGDDAGSSAPARPSEPRRAAATPAEPRAASTAPVAEVAARTAGNDSTSQSPDDIPF